MKTTKEFLEEIDETEDISKLIEIFAEYNNVKVSTEARIKKIDKIVDNLLEERTSLAPQNYYIGDISQDIICKIGQLTVGEK